MLYFGDRVVSAKSTLDGLVPETYATKEYVDQNDANLSNELNSTITTSVSNLMQNIQTAKTECKSYADTKKSEAVSHSDANLVTAKSYADTAANTVKTYANNTFEKTSNKTTTVSASSTNTQYPTAKAVYDRIQTDLVQALGDIETLLAAI